MKRIPANSNPEAQLRLERKAQAESFLDTYVYPALEQKELIDEKKLLAWLREYKREHRGPGDDFDMAVVWGRIVERLNGYSVDIREAGKPLPPELERDLKSLELFEKLDLEWIDRRMENQQA